VGREDRPPVNIATARQRGPIPGAGDRPAGIFFYDADARTDANHASVARDVKSRGPSRTFTAEALAARVARTFPEDQPPELR
jgi:hypothetical protein